MMNSAIGMVANGIWNEVGILSKVETVICAVPVVIWGAGALEGTARVIVDVAVLPFASLAGGNTTEWSEKTVQDMKIAGGCYLLAGVGMLPLICKMTPYARYILRPFSYIPSGMVYSEIHKQTRNYTKFSYAVENAKQGLVATQTNELAQKVSQDLSQAEFDELFNSVDKNLGAKVTVIQKDLDTAARNLHGTMIYKNYSYTFTYFAVKHTVTTTQKVVSFGWRTLKKVFASGYITGTIRFVGRQISNEVLYTVEIPHLPEQGDNQ